MLPDAVLNSLRDRITQEVAGTGGFRTTTARSAYQRVGLELLDGGYHEDEVVKVLTELYSATTRSPRGYPSEC